MYPHIPKIIMFCNSNKQGVFLWNLTTWAKRSCLANEQLVYNRKSRQDTLTYPDERCDSMAKGELVFNGKTITEIITILERKYDCKFFYNQHSFKE